MSQAIRYIPAWWAIFGLVIAVGLSIFFAFTAIQGDNGLFRRAEIQAEARVLRIELAALETEVATYENLIRRMSDDYLDLDLLDEQTRAVLGMARRDEVILP